MKNLILLFILLMSFQNMSSQEKFYSDGDVHLYLQTHKFKNYESDVEISFSGMGGILKLNGKRIAYNPEIYRKTSSIVIVKYYSLYDSNQTTTFILNGNSESLIDARNRREYIVVSEYSYSKIPTNRSGNKLAKEPKKEPEVSGSYQKHLQKNPNYWKDLMKSSPRKYTPSFSSQEKEPEKERNILLGKPAVGDF